MANLAGDIGYGDGKFVVVINGKLVELKFPSAICYAEKNLYNDIDNGYEFEGKKYLVGEDAVLNSFDSRNPEFLIKYAPLFVAHALKILGLKVSELKTLVTGVSILNWKRKDDMKNRLLDFKVNGIRYKFKKVIVAPQGQGVIWDHKLEKAKNVVVVDGGYLTLDGLPFQNGNIVEGAIANRNGVSHIVEEVQKEVVELTGVDYTLAEVNKIIQDGSFMRHGEKVDLSIVIKEATKKYVDMLMDTLNTKMSSHLSKANTVIISGGLAYFLKDTKMPKNVVFSKRAEFSNARGYYRIGGGRL